MIFCLVKAKAAIFYPSRCRRLDRVSRSRLCLLASCLIDGCKDWTRKVLKVKIRLLRRTLLSGRQWDCLLRMWFNLIWFNIKWFLKCCMKFWICVISYWILFFPTLIWLIELKISWQSKLRTWVRNYELLWYWSVLLDKINLTYGLQFIQMEAIFACMLINQQEVT